MYSFFPRIHRMADGATPQRGKVKAAKSAHPGRGGTGGSSPANVVELRAAELLHVAWERALTSFDTCPEASPADPLFPLWRPIGVPVACPTGRWSRVNHGRSRTHISGSCLRLRRSGRPRHDLCKQGVRGSSPLGSTQTYLRQQVRGHVDGPTWLPFSVPRWRASPERRRSPAPESSSGSACPGT